jgi:hypothetical protein
MQRAGKLALVAGLSGALAGGGCTTTLQSLPDPGRANSPSEGIPYRLPAAQFEITVTWTLKECQVAGPDDIGKAVFEAAGSYEAKVVEGESRVLDYQRMTNSFKTGNLKVEYQDKSLLLKSINATIEGKEPEAVSEGVKLAGSVAQLALGLTAPPKAGGGQVLVRTTPCRDETLDMIATLKATQARIKAIPAEAKAIGDRIAVLKARLVGNRLTKNDKAELNQRQRETDKLANELEALNEIATRLKASLSYAETWNFPETLTDRTGVHNADAAKVGSWLKGLLRAPALAQVDLSQFKASLSLKPLLTEATCDDNSCAPSVKVACDPAGCRSKDGAGYNGVVFRQPVQASLVAVVPQADKPVISATVMTPQFGRLRVLPLRSRWGEKNTLSASFAADGTPTSIEYKSDAAPGLAALKNANEAASGLLTLAAAVDAKKTADKAAKDKSELDDLNGQIAVAEARAKLAKLNKAPDDEADALEAELAILRLQKEKSDLQTAIRKNEGS